MVLDISGEQLVSMMQLWIPAARHTLDLAPKTGPKEKEPSSERSPSSEQKPSSEKKPSP